MVPRRSPHASRTAFYSIILYYVILCYMHIYIYIYIYVYVLYYNIVQYTIVIYYTVRDILSRLVAYGQYRVRPIYISIAYGQYRVRPISIYLCAKILDFRGFDSSIIFILSGGVPRPIGSLPEVLSQRILVGIILVGRLGVGAVDGWPAIRLAS